MKIGRSGAVQLWMQPTFMGGIKILTFTVGRRGAGRGTTRVEAVMDNTIPAPVPHHYHS